MPTSKQISTLSECVLAIHHINSVLDKINMKEWDFHGRRITNAGVSDSPSDYVTQKELTDAIVGLTAALAIFARRINSAISIDGGSVTIKPGEFRILDRDGKPFKLFPTPVNVIGLPPFIVEAVSL